jgi:hypothetical protein
MYRLILLPSTSIPGLAFGAAVTEHHSFLLHPPLPGPAELTVKWYLEPGRYTSGEVAWEALVVPVPPSETVDIPLPDKCRTGDRPSFLIPNRDPTHGDTKLIDMGNNETVILILLRDSGNAHDTAVGDLIVTDVEIRWPQLA